LSLFGSVRISLSRFREPLELSKLGGQCI
jgi:hypothetical protein